MEKEHPASRTLQLDVIKSAVLALIAVAFWAEPSAFAESASSASAHRGQAVPVEHYFGDIEPVFEFRGQMPTGVTLSSQGRIFVNFPRWGDKIAYTVGEIRNGKIVPYPDAAINRLDPAHPGKNLISVQSVVVDAKDRLWILDTAAPSFSAPMAGGAKLVAVDLATNRVVKTVVLPPNVVLKTTYLNDVRFDLRQGKEGVAYITDSSKSGPGGIIVVDLATGAAWRKLSGDLSTSPDPAFVPVVEGEEMGVRAPGGQRMPVRVASDGIALSADGNTLYFCPLSSRHLFSEPTVLLRNRDIPESQVAKAVRDLGEKGASDGLEADAKGHIYAGDYEHDSIRQMQIDGSWRTIAHDPRILWPDTLAVAQNAYLYFTANQLERQPGFHDGHDLRRKPYILFRVRIDAGPVALR
jgi:sugar lactone lactonase YvrE